MSTLDVAAMPISEKLMLMETLWHALCETAPSDLTAPAWHGEVLAERLRRIHGGEKPLSPWKEAKERIRAQAVGR